MTTIWDISDANTHAAKVVKMSITDNVIRLADMPGQSAPQRQS